MYRIIVIYTTFNGVTTRGYVDLLEVAAIAQSGERVTAITLKSGNTIYVDDPVDFILSKWDSVVHREERRSARQGRHRRR
jgi:hypothetical protein